MMESLLSQMCSSSYSLCSNLSSTWSLIDNPTNGLMDTLGTSVTPFPGDSAIQSMVSAGPREAGPQLRPAEMLLRKGTQALEWLHRGAVTWWKAECGVVCKV